MAAITMHSTPSLLTRLRADFPDISFIHGSDFHWSPSERTIYYKDTVDEASLIHELSHALLNHTDYKRDINLLKMEREAWEYATSHLSQNYNVTFENDAIQDALDTYRNWLHSRSICPSCEATGVQTASHLYKCIACLAEWRVNEARSCALRRYSLKTN